MIVFLHGMAPSPARILQHTAPLAREAAARGVAVLAPLGTTGLCDWSEEVKHFLCWPTRAEHDAALATTAERLRRDLHETARLLGRPESLPAVLVGFSNGGFAATHLAIVGDLDLRGLAVLHAGSRLPTPRERAVPTLLRAATGDEWHHPTMVALRDKMAEAGWDAVWQEREGPHALTETDVDALLAFVASLRTNHSPSDSDTGDEMRRVDDGT